MKKLVIGLIILWSFLGSMAIAAWQGPAEVIIGTWGSNDDQFGIEYGDTHDIFPGSFDVSIEGYIVISDGVNGRFKLFNLNGQLLRNITPPVENPKGWVIKPKFVNSNIFLIVGKMFFFSLTGEVVTTIDAPGKISFNWGNYNGKLYVEQTGPLYQWLVYSPTGQLLQTYTSKPLELGVIKERKLAPGQYKVTVKYPDKEWVIIGKGACPQYVRDTNGNLYCVGDIGVIRYDDKGNETASLMMPKKKIEEIPAKDPGVEPMIKVIEGYGSPVVAPNGDVYTWKRTPDKYYIIKWTWQP